MPRGIPNKAPETNPLTDAHRVLSAESDSLTAVLDELAVLLEARRAEFQSAADRISDILASFATPRPRVGRPPKAK